MSSTTIAQQIAAWIVRARQSPVTDEVKDAVVRCVADLVAAVAAGAKDAGPTAVRKSAVEEYGEGNCAIWFTGQSTRKAGACSTNSAIAASQDLDDGHSFAAGHPGAPVIAAVLTCARELNSTDADVIKAIYIGYEVGVYIAEAQVLTRYVNTGVWASAAVVAALGVLYKDGSEVLAHALAASLSFAPNQTFPSARKNNPVPEGSHVKEGIHWGVATGVHVLSMARNGHTGSRNILDRRDDYKFGEYRPLGAAPARICRIYMKTTANCRHVHSPMRAALAVQAAHNLDAARISKIEIKSNNSLFTLQNKVEPKSTTDVQYSAPYCVAVALLHGLTPLRVVTPQVLGDKAAEALAKKVEVTTEPSFPGTAPDGETQAIVAIHCGGQVFTSEVTVAEGASTDPLSWEDIVGKLRSVASRFMTAGQLGEVLDAVQALNDGKFGPLMACFERINLVAN